MSAGFSNVGHLPHVAPLAGGYRLFADMLQQLDVQAGKGCPSLQSWPMLQLPAEPSDGLECLKYNRAVCECPPLARPASCVFRCLDITLNPQP